MTNATQYEASRSPRRHGVGFCLLLIALLMLPACGKRNFINENDKLRAEKLELKETIGELEQQLSFRTTELQAIRQQLDEGPSKIDGVELPRLAGLVLGMYSGPIDSDGDLQYDAIRVYARPVDQHGRQITAAGKVRLRLITVPAEGDPQTILDQRLTPDEFHNSYRSGVTGTHYTLKADLPDERPDQAKLHVTLTDAATGRTFVAEKAISLKWDASAKQ